jgi:hypothetical protein
MTAQPLFRRAACLTALATLAATGCVTVHGEEAVVPAVDKKDAAGVLENFVAERNDSQRKLDGEQAAKIETGALSDLEQAQIKAFRKTKPNGNPDYQDVELTEPRFVIPRMSGWPKWFLADTKGPGGRWLLSFTRGGADEPWKASYLALLKPSEVPKFKLDTDGYAEVVPANDKGLFKAPEQLSAEYATYLSSKGKDGDSVFAKGQWTSKVVSDRAQNTTDPRLIIQYNDRPAKGPAYAPLALRTEDGGAFVLFTSHHPWKISKTPGSNITGPLDIKEALLKALLVGTPNNSVTVTMVAEQAALVPKGTAGPVEILNRMDGVISARGE